MNSIKIKAFAKINLTLDILAKRNDGYHDISSVMQTVSLFDDIEIIRKESLISLTTNLKYIPTYKRNTAYKARELFISEYGGGAEIKIKKRIPVGGGLGGSSADAAGVLIGLNKLYGNVLDQNALCALGGKIGADVPFLLTGGTALCEGLGEIITPLQSLPDCFIVITKPRFSVNTKNAYNAIDQKDNLFHLKDNNILSFISNSDLNGIAESLFNVFEQVTENIVPIKEKMLSFGALNSAMSGSGSAVFGIFDNKKLAETATASFKNIGMKTFLVSPISKKF